MSSCRIGVEVPAAYRKPSQTANPIELRYAIGEGNTLRRDIAEHTLFRLSVHTLRKTRSTRRNWRADVMGEGKSGIPEYKPVISKLVSK